MNLPFPQDIKNLHYISSMEMSRECNFPDNVLARIASEDYFVTCRMRCINKQWRQAVEEARPIRLSCEGNPIDLPQLVHALTSRPSSSCVEEVKLELESVGLPHLLMLAVRFPDLRALNLADAGSHFPAELLSHLPSRLKCLNLDVFIDSHQFRLSVFDKLLCMESLSMCCRGMDEGDSMVFLDDLKAPCLTRLDLSTSCQRANLILPDFTAEEIGQNCLFNIECCLVVPTVLDHPCFCLDGSEHSGCFRTSRICTHQAAMRGLHGRMIFCCRKFVRSRKVANST